MYKSKLLYTAAVKQFHYRTSSQNCNSTAAYPTLFTATATNWQTENRDNIQQCLKADTIITQNALIEHEQSALELCHTQTCCGSRLWKHKAVISSQSGTNATMTQSSLFGYWGHIKQMQHRWGKRWSTLDFQSAKTLIQCLLKVQHVL